MKLIQPSFNGGELSPSLYARVDIARYAISVKTAYNFIARQYGGLTNRPGFKFIGDQKTFFSERKIRLIPFEFSDDVTYVIELGHQYMRFYSNGGVVESSPGVPFEVVTPWEESQIFDVKYTQSADTLYLDHPDHYPRTLTRLTATSFQLAYFQPRLGPFRRINIDESVIVTSSAQTGEVTITSNSAIFTANHVGSYFYIESQTLGKVKPWLVGSRGIAVGDLRRSDGKTYKAVTVPTGGGATWTETGGFRPIHETGRAWDGGGDVRTDGTSTWIVGIEWEYQDSSYGVVKITGFTSSAQVSAIVVRQLPADVIGGVGAPANTWSFVGNGSTKVFSITGAVSDSTSLYSVTIDGVPLPSNPYVD